MHNKVYNVYHKGVENGRVKALSQELGVPLYIITRYAHMQGWSTRPNKIFEEKKIRESRVFASLHCASYRKCRDKAAYANKPMNCHKCERLVFDRDHYLKEVGVESINNHHTDEYDIQVDDTLYRAITGG